MTIKELFNSCDFSEVAEEIAKIDERQAEVLYCYKEVFDMHRNAEDKSCENADKVNRRKLITCHEVGDEEFAGLEVDTDEGKEGYSPACLVARILWERTFYGFGEDELPRFVLEKYYRRTQNGQKAFALETERYVRLWTTSNLKEKIRRRIEKHKCIGFTLEEWEYMEKREQECSETTKRWLHETDEEIKRLKRRSHVEYLIGKLTENGISGKSMTAEELDFLYDAGCCYAALRSYTGDERVRCAYIQDLLNWNFGKEFMKCDHAVIQVVTSPECPFRDDESLDFIKTLFPDHAEFKVTFCQDPKRGKEIKVFIVGYTYR